MRKILALATASLAVASIAAPAAAQQVNVQYNGSVVLSNGGLVSPLTTTLDLTGTLDVSSIDTTNTAPDGTLTLENVDVSTPYGSANFGSLLGVFTNDGSGASISLFNGTDTPTNLLITFSNIMLDQNGPDLLDGTATITGGDQDLNFNGSLVGIQGGAGNIAVTAAVPEPATWAMMLIGFGAMGLAVRRKRTQVLSQIA